MDYSREAIGILPIAVAATVVVYLVVFFVRHRRRRPPWPRLLAEFCLTGAVVTFVYVTQIMAFGNGMGELLNLAPLRSLQRAAKYGLANSDGFVQLALNVLITVPIGALLPIVFPQRFGRVRRVFLAGLVLALATEGLQLATGRNADIDDVIANTAGAALGAALTTLALAVGTQYLRLQPGVSGWRAAASVTVVVGVIAPFAVVTAINGGNRLGVVYYGHLQPARVLVQDVLPVQEGEGRLYRYDSGETQQAAAERLRGRLGVRGACVPEGDVLRCEDPGSKTLFVYPHNTWSLDYAGTPGTGDVPDLKTGVPLAEERLKEAGIDVSMLTFNGADSGFKDGDLHLRYTSREEDETRDRLLWGAVRISLGPNGAALGITDERVPVGLVETVPTISARDALAIAQDVGVGEMPLTATVTSITASHHFDQESGYLIPVWRFEGTMPQRVGDAIEWHPDIDARRG
ncbi:VanZ family protein [Spongiactinospora sp. TRM90649]|uniref:VanZ family protein n=1 Tax=Spongiactinospora sp. TRM90649 TaxID=3031114 RepID=UPI0023F9EB48|nr:VanZ family protein [Spongiactinospora sp. TRM90649]MDF5754659.1 VanZ family protein [Spongiactinospora sp. TRM90649]